MYGASDTHTHTPQRIAATIVPRLYEIERDRRRSCNHFVVVCFFVGMLSLFSSLACKPLTVRAATNYCNDAGAVGCWYMDGTSTEYDRTPNGNDLAVASTTVQGGLHIVDTGFSGASRHFNLFATTGYLSKNVEGGVLDITGASAKVSLTARIKLVSAPGNGLFATIVGKYNGNTNQRQYNMWALGTGSNNFKFRGAVSTAGTSGAVVDTTGTTYTINTWYDVTFVDNNTDLRMYVNGVLDSTPVGYTGGIFNGSEPFTVGGTQTSINTLIGYVDEVAVFNRPLLSTEVADIYTNGITGNTGGNDTSPPTQTNFYSSDGVLPTYTTMGTQLDALCASNPTWQCVTYGQSAQQRNIRGVIIAPPGYTKTILLDTGIHGNELVPVKGLLGFLNYLAANPTLYPTIRWVTVLMDNPDGVVAVTRKNNDTPAGRQVDLNRNFPIGWGQPYLLNGVDQGNSTDPAIIFYMGPSAASEPETQVLESLVQAYHPQKALSAHSAMNTVLSTTVEGLSMCNYINTYLYNNGWEGQGCILGDPAGQWRNYSLSQGVESYEYETGSDTVANEVNRYIGSVNALATSPMYYAVGVLGSNNGASLTSLTAGNQNNCYAGTVSNFSGTGPWTWYCAGIGGGADSGMGSASLLVTVPTLTTSAATEVFTSTAILNASITATGGADATQSGFAYGTVSNLSTVIATSTLNGQTGNASFSQSLTNLTPNTTYYFRAYAFNSAGTSTGSILPFATTDVTPPSVSMTSPTGGTTVAGSSISLSASASDDVGVVGVQFKLDGTTNIGSEVTIAPYTTTWDSTEITIYGSHTLYAVARDAAGNRATSTVIVTVDNALHTIGGTISGLSGTVVLQNNSGDNLTVTANGVITFATGLHYAASYNVSIITQPAGQTCTISSGSGLVSSENVTSVSVACTNNSITSTPTPIVTTSYSSSGGGSASSQVNNLIAMGNYTLAQQIAKQYGIVIPQQIITASADPRSTQSFTRTLKVGMTGADVKQLQIFLNTQGFIIAKKGAGSPGHETTTFGSATKAALMKFQLAHKKEILDPQGLNNPTGVFAAGSMKVANALLK